MIVPDIQNYMDAPDRYKYVEAIADYYIDNKSDFVACLQVGDLTNNNQVSQYENAFNHFFSKFPKGDEPIFCLGNHDYGNNGISDVRKSNIPSYMRARYDIRMEGSDYENYVRFISFDYLKYAILVLEFAPRNEAISWANEIVQRYKDIPFILLTHVFTNKYGQIHDSRDDNVYHGGSPKGYDMSGDYINDSAEVFDKLINNNPNIKIVICGHTFIPDYIEVTSRSNSIGKEVYVVTVNYQHSPEGNYNGGNSYVGLLEFDKDENYSIRSFSTMRKQYGDVNISFGKNTIVLN